MIETVELPCGEKASLCVTFQGCPPAVSSLVEGSPTSKWRRSLHIGLYIHKLIVPGLEISCFRDAEQLRETLEIYRDVSPKFLTLSDVKPDESPTLYSIPLPSGELRGMTFKGFPPVVSSVDENCQTLLSGLLQPGQVVQRFVVPSRNVNFSLASGGFTNANLVRAIQESFDADDRRLVIKFDIPQTPRSQLPSDAAWDWDSFKVLWPAWNQIWSRGQKRNTRRAPWDAGPTYALTPSTFIAS